MKYFVVSDIHGYYSSLQKALTQKGFDIDDPNHMLIICGDMMDRGDCPVQMQTYVKQLIIKKKVILIRGNHEDVAVDLIRNYYKYYKQIKNTHYFSNGTFQTLLALTNMTINGAMRFPIRFIYKAKRTPYHPNYEIWANKGKYRLKKANISRFWLIFFDFENILRNNYAPFGCNYAPDWCIFFAPCHHKNRGNKRAEI